MPTAANLTLDGLLEEFTYSNGLNDYIRYLGDNR